MVKIELTEKEITMLYAMCNSIQYKGIKFLMDYETGLFKSEELKKWYIETKEEFKDLQILKEKFKNG